MASCLLHLEAHRASGTAVAPRVDPRDAQAVVALGELALWQRHRGRAGRGGEVVARDLVQRHAPLPGPAARLAALALHAALAGTLEGDGERADLAEGRVELERAARPDE